VNISLIPEEITLPATDETRPIPTLVINFSVLNSDKSPPPDPRANAD